MGGKECSADKKKKKEREKVTAFEQSSEVQNNKVKSILCLIHATTDEPDPTASKI